jgi:hypothetical protein
VGLQYDRYCSITLSGAGGTFDLAKLRCRFTIKQSTSATPGTLLLKITNQNPKIARQLASMKSEYTNVVVDAGYQSGHGIIFKGNIVFATYGRESPTDTLTTVLCSDGDQARNYATVSKSFAPGSTPQQHLNAAVQAMGQYGVQQGFIGSSINLSKPAYPRGVALFGMARDIIAKIAKSQGATWSIQKGEVHIAGPNDSIPGSTVVLNSGSGLIGMPTVAIGGIYARCLINPQIKVNGLVKIDQSLIQGLIPQLDVNGQVDPAYRPGAPDLPSIAADGIYKIFKIDAVGDTRGNEFYMDIGCLVPSQQTSAYTEATARTN